MLATVEQNMTTSQIAFDLFGLTNDKVRGIGKNEVALRCLLPTVVKASPALAEHQQHQLCVKSFMTGIVETSSPSKIL